MPDDGMASTFSKGDRVVMSDEGIAAIRSPFPGRVGTVSRTPRPPRFNTAVLWDGCTASGPLYHPSFLRHVDLAARAGAKGQQA